jgi:hypothetical protein
VPVHLLDRRGDQRAIRTDGRALVLVGGKGHHDVREQLGGRLVAREDQLGVVGNDFLICHVRAGVLVAHHGGDQVRTALGCTEAHADLRTDVVVERRGRTLADGDELRAPLTRAGVALHDAPIASLHSVN